MLGIKNNPIILSCRLDDKSIDKYPGVLIYNSGGTYVNSYSLIHISGGYYNTSEWTPTETGSYTANYTIFSDSNLSIPHGSYNAMSEYILVINEPSLSSQCRGISSQLYEIPTSSQLSSWHGVGSWQTGAGGVDISKQVNFISSQIHWLSGMTIGVSSQVLGVSSQIHGSAFGLTADVIWAYTNRTLTDIPGGSIDNISSQINYISSQLTYISSNLEAYGGGGGGSQHYVMHTSKQSPWKNIEKLQLIEDVKGLKEDIDNLKKKLSDYNKEEINTINHVSEKLSQKIHFVESIIKDYRDKISKLAENSDKLKQLNDIQSALSIVKSELNKKPDLNKITKYLEDVEKMFKSIDRTFTFVISSKIEDDELDNEIGKD